MQAQPDLIYLMDKGQLDAMRERARQEYGTERAAAARKRLREAVNEQLDRELQALRRARE